MSTEEGARMKSSKKNQRTIAAGEKSSMKSRENELGEETLEMVQGGELSPADVTHITNLAKQAGQQHGVNVGATALDYGLGAAIDFAAYSGGNAITKPKNKKN